MENLKQKGDAFKMTYVFKLENATYCNSFE
jgi:hypothetical protein